MRVGGVEYSRARIVPLVGDMRQLAEVVPVSFQEGRARGMRGLSVRIAGGFCFDVLIDRGLDIGHAALHGTPLTWRSASGISAPEFAEHSGAGWTRTFGGGLLTTCGMMNVGAGSRDGGEDLGLHGRISHLPAEEVSYRREWTGDDLDVVIQGRVVETDLAGPTLERRRTIRARVGVPEISIEDTVTNTGAVDAAHMYRFHANFGFPLVQPGDEITAGGDLAGCRSDAPVRAQPWTTVAEPSATAGEEVLYIEDPAEGATGTGTVSLHRPGARGPHLSLEWSRDTMPILVVWKFQRSRTNVLALEPSTARDEGRAAARTAGELITLRPDETRTYRLRIRADPAPEPQTQD